MIEDKTTETTILALRERVLVSSVFAGEELLDSGKPTGIFMRWGNTGVFTNFDGFVTSACDNGLVPKAGDVGVFVVSGGNSNRVKGILPLLGAPRWREKTITAW